VHSNMSTKMYNSLGIGCSFTNQNYKFREHEKKLFGKDRIPWSTWDHLVANYYEWNHLNIGQSGRGLDWMVDTIHSVDTSLYDVLIVGGSTWDRFTTAYYNPATLRYSHIVMKGDTEATLPYEPNVEYAIAHTLSNIISLIHHCIINDKKLIYAQILPPFDHYQHKLSQYKQIKNLKHCERYMLKNKMFETIEKYRNHPNINILGWPFYEMLGGSSVWIWNDKKICISNDDRHPNAKGHIFIAERITDLLGEIKK